MCEKFFMMFEPQLKGEDEKKKKTNNFFHSLRFYQDHTQSRMKLIKNLRKVS